MGTLDYTQVKHDGTAWKIYNVKFGNFENDLDAIGAFLEELEQKGEEPFAFIPNIGRVPFGYAGTVGMAILVKKKA